ncbi:MAG: VTC domain-containing protein [Planctomycetes bacterium]|nr:VTC domain-containing protein [Planctomycetota bacterium]
MNLARIIPGARRPRPERPARTNDGPSDARYEIKLLCQGLAYERVLTELRLHQCALRTLHPSRRVQSLYLDTHDRRSLEDNLAGISDREKIRLRWYGDGVDWVRGTLERKIRQNLLGWKRSFSYPEPIRVNGASRLGFVRSLWHAAPPEFRAVLDDGQEPAQWISYTRDYLITGDGTIRVTVDHGVRSADQRDRAALSFDCPTPTPNVTIVECKVARHRYDALREFLNSMPLVIDKCSKFVIASDPAAAPIVSILPS